MTRLVRFSNNAVSRLAANITNVATTISLTPGDGAKFPIISGTQFFMATLIKADGTTEIVKVTARSSDTLTVVRAAEPVGSTQVAYAFTAGDRIEQRLTAKALSDELDRLDSGANIGTANKTANYTVLANDVSNLIRVDTTSGTITVTLPQISSLTDDFDIMVAKVTGDANLLNVVRAGTTDLINGVSSYVINNQWQSVWLIADRSTGTWTAINSGAGSTNITTDSFTGSGTAGPFTLSGDPGSKNNTAVYVGGVYQQKATYTLSGTSLTLGGTVEAGVAVEVVWAKPNPIGVPSDGTVTTLKLADGAVTNDKVEANAGIEASKLAYTPAGIGAVSTTVEQQLQNIQGYVVNVKDAPYYAKGNGIDDDTAAIQAAFDSSSNNIYFPEGIYQFKNLVMPNKRMTIFGDGHWRTSLRCESPVSTDYGIASSAYVNNLTTGNEPVTIRELTINGSNLVNFPLVIYGYYSEVRNSRVANAKLGGRCVKFTGNGISGSACTTTLVENKLVECTITGGDGDAFIIIDSSAKCTDMMVLGNVFSDGAVTFATMAGHCVTDNHFYAGAVQFNKLSVGTVISNNYFENTVTLDDFKDEVVGLSGNRFLARVSVDFGAGGKVCVFDGNLWQGSADLYHNYFASDKRAVVNGGGFETATPVVFHSGTSTGWVSFNNVYSYSTATFWTGSRQGAVSSIRQEIPFASVVSANYGDASATLTWLQSATTNRWTSALTTDKTVTLSTTNAINGAKFRIIRTGGGAFNLNVGVGPLKALSTNQWCEVEYDGSAWVLTAFGSL
ncbi:MAG: glycosyl hydrolase family 28-related protein [Aestuariivirga sp.]